MEYSVPLVILVIAVIFISQSVKFVPQQNAWVRERLGKYHSTMTPGANFLIPFIDKVAYKHSLKEIPLDVPSQICITRDNTQLQVDGILYFQVTDPMRASYGSSNYIVAVTQLAQTSLRSVVGKLELDKTFEERDVINAQVVAAIDEAALNWGVKVLRYEFRRREAGADQQRPGRGGGHHRPRRGHGRGHRARRRGDPPARWRAGGAAQDRRTRGRCLQQGRRRRQDHPDRAEQHDRDLGADRLRDAHGAGRQVDPHELKSRAGRRKGPRTLL